MALNLYYKLSWHNYLHTYYYSNPLPMIICESFQLPPIMVITVNGVHFTFAEVQTTQWFSPCSSDSWNIERTNHGTYFQVKRSISNCHFCLSWNLKNNIPYEYSLIFLLFSAHYCGMNRTNLSSTPEITASQHCNGIMN